MISYFIELFIPLTFYFGMAEYLNQLRMAEYLNQLRTAEYLNQVRMAEYLNQADQKPKTSLSKNQKQT